MTIFISPEGTAEAQTAGDIPAAVGAAPVGATMQGNPQQAQYQPHGVQPPAPLTPVQQLTGTQMSSGQIPVNAQPTNVAVVPGGDTLLAQMSRGQVAMCDSTYGQGGFIQQNGGSSPQAQQPAATNVQPVTARVASVMTYPSPANYVGN